MGMNKKQNTESDLRERERGNKKGEGESTQSDSVLLLFKNIWVWAVYVWIDVGVRNLFSFFFVSFSIFPCKHFHSHGALHFDCCGCCCCCCMFLFFSHRTEFLYLARYCLFFFNLIIPMSCHCSCFSRFKPSWCWVMMRTHFQFYVNVIFL